MTRTDDALRRARRRALGPLQGRTTAAPPAAPAKDATSILADGPQGPLAEMAEHCIAALDDAAVTDDVDRVANVLLVLHRAATCRRLAVSARLAGEIKDATRHENASNRYLVRAATAIGDQS